MNKEPIFKVSKQEFVGHILNVQGACNSTLDKLKVLHADDAALLAELEFIFDSIDFLVNLLTKIQ